MSDIAKAAGVSPMTVSRAFKADASVGKKTREKILKIAEEMGYVFDSTASNLRSQKSGFVAATIPSLNNANFADTVRGLNEAMRDKGLQLLLGYTDYNVENEERLIEQLLRRRPEAMVVTGGRHTDRARRLLLNASIPVVETWDLPEDPVGHTVGFSNADAMAQLVEHLHASGARRLAFIGGDDNGDTRGADRRKGFVSKARALGLEYRLVSLGAPPVSMREGARAMAELLDGDTQPDAVLCVSDLAAFGVLTECQRRGIDVPGEMMIAGFGAFDLAEISVPTLTTIDAHAYDIGARTGALLAEILRGDSPQDGAPSIMRIRPTLKVSRSTAAK
ncbi:LacI family transcriptional regulator [Actibacterium mucosum KCTC 23349]|uniref:LacI family transcriptional regulator n=2 Tax=Actibacterium TaxID=1433986 RepID=A0A037ZDQ5_9RHOB|nr:LacI family transcriptional regulator [Actibacterium mucosum KCTC 23349]